MEKKFLIVGCGISGLAFSWHLKKANINFTILDPCESHSASLHAGSLINPITGRKFQLQWNIQSLREKAITFYSELEEFLADSIFKNVEILKIFGNSDSERLWQSEKLNPQIIPFINETYPENLYASSINASSGVFIIKQVLQIHAEKLILDYREKLLQQTILIKKSFDQEKLKINKGKFLYEGSQYSHIVFCNGLAALQSEYFHWLPFKPAKGEHLIIEVKNLAQQFILHKGIFLIPKEENIFWAGATNTWNDLKTNPTYEGKMELENQLKALLKIPFKIIEHKAAIRPTMKDRTPVVGEHPKIKNMFILNGMGTKGMSLAPFYAELLLQHILTKSPLPQEANVLRFAQLIN